MFSIVVASVINSASRRQGEAAKSIASFYKFKRGWRYGMGDAPTSATLLTSLLVDKELRLAGVSKTNAFLNEDGSIMITAYFENSTHFEITIRPDGRATFDIEKCGVVEFEREINVSELQALIPIQVRLWGDVAHTSVSSTSGTSTKIWADSKAEVSQSLRRIKAYPLFVPTAPKPQAAQDVRTSASFTQILQESLQFSGNLLGTLFPQ